MLKPNTSKQKTKIMKKTILNLATFAIVSILLFSCRKNDKLENPVDQFEVFKSTNQSQPQIFTISGSTGGSLTGTKGTKITFPPNCFVNNDGSAFTGDAIVMLQESLKKSDWMMDGLSTTTQNEPIISAGMLNVNAVRKDNGAGLKPAPAMEVPNANLNAVIKAEVPRNAGAAGIDMNLFLPDTPRVGGGVPVNAPNAPVLAWQNANYYPFGNGPNSYIFQLPKFGWSNCDRLSSIAGPKTTIKVTPDMTNFTGASGLQVMLVYKSVNMVITLVPKTSFFESYLNSIPVGGIADVVLIGKTADGKILFKAIAANTFTVNQNINITPDVVPSATVSAYLNTL
jgi:hypothetical protein